MLRVSVTFCFSVCQGLPMRSKRKNVRLLLTRERDAVYYFD